MNIRLHVSFWIIVFSGYVSRSATVRSHSRCLNGKCFKIFLFWYKNKNTTCDKVYHWNHFSVDSLVALGTFAMWYNHGHCPSPGLGHHKLKPCTRLSHCPLPLPKPLARLLWLVSVNMTTPGERCGHESLGPTHRVPHQQNKLPCSYKCSVSPETVYPARQSSSGLCTWFLHSLMFLNKVRYVPLANHGVSPCYCFQPCKPHSCPDTLGMRAPPPVHGLLSLKYRTDPLPSGLIFCH